MNIKFTKRKKRELTYSVKTITTTTTEIPELPGKTSNSFLATKMQKTATGATMRNIVKKTDKASGPKTNLPPRQNFCTS